MTKPGAATEATEKQAMGRQVTIIAHEVHRDGGMENVMRETILALLDGGWHVRLYAKACDRALGEEADLDFRRIPTPRRPFIISYPLFALWSGVRLAVDRPRGLVLSVGANVPNRVDVVAVHFCHAGFSKLGMRQSAKLGTLHKVNSYLGSRMSIAAERWCYRPTRVRAMTTVSPKIREELLSAFPLDEVPIEVISNGVDIDHFRPDIDLRRTTRNHLSVGENELTAVFVGGDWQRKGLDIAMRAAAEAHWRLIVVGRGDADGWSRRATELGLQTNFVGHVSDTRPFLTAGDAFVLPSSYEGFALVCLEAAACGLPILATDATGAGDLIVAAGSEVLPRTSEAFRNALSALGADREIRRQAGEAARLAASKYEWPNIRLRHRAFLEQLGHDLSA